MIKSSVRSQWLPAWLAILLVPVGFVLWSALQEPLAVGVAGLPQALLVVVLHALARRYPVRLVVAGRDVEFTTSLPFGIALLLIVPWNVAVLALGVAALVPTRTGEPWLLRAVRDVEHNLLLFGACAWMLTLMEAQFGALPAGGVLQLVVVVPIGLVAYLVDVVQSVMVTATGEGADPRKVLRQDRSRFEPVSYMLLTALAPAVVVISQHSLLLTPLFLIVAIGLHGSSGATAHQEHAANHDELTGLGNRRQLDERLAQLTSDPKLEDGFALLLMDLDRFKEVNDRLGHHVGDDLLRQVGVRLAGLEAVDLAIRLGGDEFAFIVRRTTDHEGLLEHGRRIVDEVTQPYVVQDIRLAIGASVGIAIYPDHGLDGSSLLRRADSAMYSAKRSGVPVGLATVLKGDPAPPRVSLLTELQEAMERGQLRLSYQPKVSLATGEIAGVEALLRWHHPERGLIPPDAYMSTVEHTDMIGSLTRHVFDLVLDDTAKWAVAGVEVPIAINVSTRDLQNRRFPGDLAERLVSERFPRGSLILEVTETALQIDPARTRQVMEEIREMGVGLAIDDFGTGYSSLSMLRQLPAAEIKIDRSFISDMGDPQGLAIVESIVNLAHALDLVVVAEGVEDEAALHRLTLQGCDLVQGYFISRPLPSHMVPPWVRARRQELASGKAPLPLELPPLVQAGERFRVV